MEFFFAGLEGVWDAWLLVGYLTLVDAQLWAIQAGVHRMEDWLAGAPRVHALITIHAIDIRLGHDRWLLTEPIAPSWLHPLLQLVLQSLLLFYFGRCHVEVSLFLRVGINGLRKMNWCLPSMRRCHQRIDRVLICLPARTLPQWRNRLRIIRTQICVEVVLIILAERRDEVWWIPLILNDIKLLLRTHMVRSRLEMIDQASICLYRRKQVLLNRFQWFLSLLNRRLGILLPFFFRPFWFPNITRGHLTLHIQALPLKKALTIELDDLVLILLLWRELQRCRLRRLVGWFTSDKSVDLLLEVLLRYVVAEWLARFWALGLSVHQLLVIRSASCRELGQLCLEGRHSHVDLLIGNGARHLHITGIEAYVLDLDLILDQ